MKSNKLSIIFLLIFIVLVVGLMYGFKHLNTSDTRERLQGQVEAQQYSVSSKIAGRIDEICVKKGDTIHKGQLIFTLHTPEINAKLAQAQAGKDAATAVAEQAEKGARTQEIRAAKDQWNKAVVAAQLAEKTYQRVQNLYKEGVLPEQKKDEAYTQFKAAQFNQSTAYQQYKLAKEGARPETKRAAQDQVRMAQGSIDEVEAYLADARVESAFDGEVSNVLLHSGELAPKGFPVVRVINMQDAWVVLNVREDRLKEFQKGAQIKVKLPAISEDKLFDMTVTYIAPMGDFATWRSTDSRQGYDMRTFEVHAYPNAPIEHWRVGMTAIVDLK